MLNPINQTKLANLAETLAHRNDVCSYFKPMLARLGLSLFFAGIGRCFLRFEKP